MDDKDRKHVATPDPTTTTTTSELTGEPSTCWTLDDSDGVYFYSSTDRESSILSEFGWNHLEPDLHDRIGNHDRSYSTGGSSSVWLQQEENSNYARFTTASGSSEAVPDQFTTSSNNQSVSSSSSDDPPEKSTGSDEKPAELHPEAEAECVKGHRDLHLHSFIHGLTRSKVKRRVQKRIRQPRFAFMTKSDIDHLEDGYRWRKYGQKAVKNSPFPRSYYRCTNSKCTVKKRVERSSEDPSIVITTYEGQHCHHTIGFSRGGVVNHNFAFVGQMPPQMSRPYYASELPRESFLRRASFRQVEDEADGSRSVPDPTAHLPTDEGLLGDMVPDPMRNR